MDVTEAEGFQFGEKEICDLLEYFSCNTYSLPRSNNEPRPYLDDVMDLMQKDYIIDIIKNKDGYMCPQYPEYIPVMEDSRSVSTIYENQPQTKARKLDSFDTVVLFETSRLARCRQRFAVPVIWVNGRYVCRSATLACEPEIIYRTGLIKYSGYELLHSMKELWWPTEGLGPTPEVHEDPPVGPGPYDNDDRVQSICDRARYFDIQLLRGFNINTIIDIMVEKRKVKHGLYVCSSEKVDLCRYNGFNLVSLPYPGCEFFKDYHDAMYNAEGLKYNWEHPSNNASISVPNDSVKQNLSISWENYKEWDLIHVTQNYLKYILKRLQEDDTGILLHCISGWDRTPLFISLIRLSLWADNLVHPSLNEYEILYLTLAYDWYLFAHHLNNRLYKKEEIMAFCFDFLRYITSEEFSSKTTKKKHSDEMKIDDSRSPSRSSNSSSVGMEDSSGTTKKKHSDEMKADESRSSSRSSGSSSSNTDNIGHKKKKLLPSDLILIEANENSNDSATIAMDVADEDSNSYLDAETLAVKSGRLFSPEDMLMDTAGGDEFGKSKLLSPTKATHRRTSPIPVGGTPGRRQRSESTGSNSSNISANWQLISDCGSIEKDVSFKPLRYQRLEKVRSIFNSCYQKSVKNESFGPPKKWMFEEIIGNIAQWTQTLYRGTDKNPEHSSNGTHEGSNGTHSESNGTTDAQKESANNVPDAYE